MMKNVIRTISLITIFVLSLLYLRAAIQHSNLINIRSHTADIDHGDQTAYLEAIKKTYNDNFYLGDRNRMPLYTSFQSIFYTPGISDEQLFIQAKFINIFLSFALIFLIFIFNQRSISKFSNTVFTLIISFSVFMPRAAYVQPELLYFTLSFFAFVYFCKTIKDKKMVDTIHAAVLAVLAYFTKASMLLGFDFFVLFLFLTGLRGLRPKRALVIPIVTASLFLLAVSPYLIQTKRLYGSYFFNYSTTYMWSENWNEILTIDKKLHNIEYLRFLPIDQLPSFNKYIKEHSISNMTLRMFSGIILNIRLLLGTYAALSSAILIFYLIFLIFFIFSNIRVANFQKYISQKSGLIIFILVYLLLYFLAFSWYTPIGAGPRFIVPLYMPALFSIFYLMEIMTFRIKDNKGNLSHNKGLFYLIHIMAILILFVGLKITLLPILTTSWAGF